ncbi:unnamed protein product, partial [Bubo scandiacus]
AQHKAKLGLVRFYSLTDQEVEVGFRGARYFPQLFLDREPNIEGRHFCKSFMSMVTVIHKTVDVIFITCIKSKPEK